MLSASSPLWPNWMTTELVLPDNAAVQQPTLLAVHDDSLRRASPGQHGAQPRLERQSGAYQAAASPPPVAVCRRRAAALFWAGICCAVRFSVQPKPALIPPGEAAVAVTEPANIAPSASEPFDSMAQKNNSALEAVESGRQQKGTESMAAADRSQFRPGERVASGRKPLPQNSLTLVSRNPCLPDYSLHFLLPQVCC